jgi:LTXXQ motif family protein
MRIFTKLVSAPFGAFALVSMVAVAPAAESRGGAQAAEKSTILGPAMLRPGTADLGCGAGQAGLGPWGADRIEQSLSLTQAQLAKFNDLKSASQKAREYLKESCPSTDPVTPTGRLTSMEQRLEAMLEAVRIVKPALDDFYSALNDEQKARLNAFEPVSVADRGTGADRGARGSRVARTEATDGAAPADQTAPAEHAATAEHAAPAEHADAAPDATERPERGERRHRGHGRRHYGFRLPLIFPF